MKIVSWNVNGIVACRRKGLIAFLSKTKPDMLCLQEIKTVCHLNTPGYLQYWFPAKANGYSGTLVLTRREPLSVRNGLGIRKFDAEGRSITLEYEDFILVNIYVPSVHTYSDLARVNYRLEWDKALRKYVSKLKKPAILCGDFNVAHAYIDCYPENQKNTPNDGIFCSDLQDGFGRLLETGLTDVFRFLYPERDRSYTWWGPKGNNRAFNRGSRLDYFLVSAQLLPYVADVVHYTDVHGSDHCPISLEISIHRKQARMDAEDYAVYWRTIDWGRADVELLEMQRELAEAAFYRNWNNVEQLRKRIENSWIAKAKAVRDVVEADSAYGVDGVKWLTDAQKGEAAMSLTPWDYDPLPYRSFDLVERGKQRHVNVPAVRDKAMQILEKYALAPIVSSTVDAKVCSGVRGRSQLDAHAYLVKNLSGPNSPDFVTLVDVRRCYESASQDWLIQHTPINKNVLRKILKAGVIIGEEIVPTEQGMSLGSPLSPLLLNVMLNGLQSYIYNRLYPEGNTDYLDGDVIRSADDMAITTRSKQRGEMIIQIVQEFLAERGLTINQEKTKVVDARQGFDFLGRHYQKRGGVLTGKPAESAMKLKEQELGEYIRSHSGSLRNLITELNAKLRGFGTYHKPEDAYEEFRRLDTAVEFLLLEKMCAKYPRWHRETVQRKFWLKDGSDYVFALPSDHSVQVIRLARQPIVWHEPCKPNFNWYLDADYRQWLDERRKIQKVSGKYRIVWNRQSGKCACCGSPLLPDQQWDVIEDRLGEGRGIQNLLYVHKRCEIHYSPGQEDTSADWLDLMEIGTTLLDEAPPEESPYWELTEFFRLCDQSPVRLTFREIERIIGDYLDAESRFYEAFWYDTQPGQEDPMWESEGYPDDTCRLSNQRYCIAHSWTSQGYKIKHLHLEQEYVVFQRTAQHKAGLQIPQRLFREKLPKAFVQEFNAVCDLLLDKYGL